MKLKEEYWVIYRAAYQHTELSENQIKEIKYLYKRDGREAISEAAKTKKLMPAIAYLMCKLEIDVEYWRPIVEFYRTRNEKVIVCLDEMYRLLSENGIDHIAVVENFGALLASSQDLAMFGSGDIDEYAEPEQKEKIYSVLRKAGYSVEEVKSGCIIVSSSIRREDFPENFYFGINWNITNRVNLPSFSAKGDFIGWDRCRFYDNTYIRLPSPEGLMYVCLMHIAVHGFCKAPDIRLYYDIANAAEQEIDWEKLCDRAKQDGNSVKMAVGAYLAYKLLDVDIPSFVFSSGNQKQRSKLLSTVYCENKNKLNDFPNKISRVLIDIYSEDSGAVCGIKKIICPNSKWIKQKYGSITLGHIKHIINILK